MPVFNVANWVRENSSSTGTGPLTLTGAVGNNPTFLEVFGVGVTSKINYSILDNDVEVEAGQGSYDGGTNVFTRGPLATWNGIAYNVSAPPPINLAGPVQLRITLNAAQYASIVEEAPSDDNYKMRRNEAWTNVPLAFSAQWTFDNVTTEADPGLGDLRLNTGAFATTTELYVSHETLGGLDLNIFLEKVAVEEPILLHRSSDVDRIALYSVSAAPVPDVPMPNTLWWKIPVTFADEGTGGFLQNGKAVTINFIGLGSGGGTDWGDIGGVLSDQDDLQGELNNKVNLSRRVDTALPLNGGGALSTNLTLSFAIALLPNKVPASGDYLYIWDNFSQSQHWCTVQQLPVPPEAPFDDFGYLREGYSARTWVRGMRIFEQVAEPTMSIGDSWIPE